MARFGRLRVPRPAARCWRCWLAGLRDQAQAAARRHADGRGRRAAQVRSVEAVATDADEDRIARLGLAWQEALAEARKSNARRCSTGKARCCGRAPALPRPAPTPGQLQLPADQARQGDRQEPGLRKLQAVLLLRRGRGRSADHRQADRQPAARPAGCGRTMTRPAWSSSAASRSATRTSRSPMATTPSATWPACSSGSRRSNGGWSSRGRKARPSSTCSS